MDLGCATTCPGLEQVLGDELAGLGARPVDDALRIRGWLTFEVANLEHLAQLLVSTRLAHRFGVLLRSDRVDPRDPFRELAELVESVDWTPWVPTGGPWALRVTRRGEHPFESMDVEHRLGAVLHDELAEQLGQRPPVDLDDPGAMIRLHLDDDGRVRLWIDLVGPRSLHRRGYRVHQHRAALKSSIGAALVRMTGWTGQGTLVDPMAGGGTLPIEAAWQVFDVPPAVLRRDDVLATRTPVLDGALALTHLQAVQLPSPGEREPCFRLVLGDRNPKHVAGSRRNLDDAGVAAWAKHHMGDVSTLAEHVDQAAVVVSNPPYGIRSAHPRELAPTYEAFFEQVDGVLEPDGRVGLVTPLVELVSRAAGGHGFEVRERIGAMHGKVRVELIVLARA